MNIETEIVRKTSPEEEELASKQRELALLLAELTERELSLATLKAELAAFEGQYLREVGTLYAELDEWIARIAELTAEREATSEARAAAYEARQQAEETYASAHGTASTVAEFTPSPELKKLYREVVNTVHPDRATTEDDRVLRDRLMKEATAAYSRGDMPALQAILDEYRSSPESVPGFGLAAELRRVTLEIIRVRKRITQIGLEITEQTASPMAKLIAKKVQLESQGRELFSELAAEIRRRIVLAGREYDALSGRRSTI